MARRRDRRMTHMGHAGEPNCGGELERVKGIEPSS